jgi:hypothetical protein
MTAFTMSFVLQGQLYEIYTQHAKEIREKLRTFLRMYLLDLAEEQKKILLAKPLTEEQKKVLSELSSIQIQTYFSSMNTPNNP